METGITRIVVVGGGTAGWLAACLLAAKANRGAPGRDRAPLQVTLVEAPDIPTIGVGEGTWPTMRGTLAAIGLSEPEFLLACDASFKQGSRFDGWLTGEADDSYLHPFTPPAAASPRALVEAWTRSGDPFATAVTPQARVAAQGLAPRQRAMPDYAGALNYAYHLDAAKLAALLARHGTERLGVRHLRDQVTDVEQADTGDIRAVITRDNGRVEGDLFLDCTGHAARLIGGCYGVPLIDRGTTLFNDRALAMQVPVAQGSPIAAQTNATAHAAGWIWDIGLPTRRGIGCVYASAFASDDQAAATLAAYVRRCVPGADPDQLPVRRLTFQSAHRETFWQNNCLAIGLSAGFLEPLEASAIVLIELSLQALLDGFPTTRASLPIHARRFNELFRYRWDRIVDFLKLHYVLSRREEPYWQAHQDPATIPPRLAELLTLWQDQPPSPADLPMVDEVFPAASYQYVLYGMAHPAPPPSPIRTEAAEGITAAAEQRARVLASTLPTNRAYLDALRQSVPAANRAAP